MPHRKREVGAHILIQVARHQGREVHAFTRPGDDKGVAFAEQLGAAWTGSTTDAPPEPLEEQQMEPYSGLMTSADWGTPQDEPQESGEQDVPTREELEKVKKPE